MINESKSVFKIIFQLATIFDVLIVIGTYQFGVNICVKNKRENLRFSKQNYKQKSAENLYESEVRTCFDMSHSTLMIGDYLFVIYYNSAIVNDW